MVGNQIACLIHEWSWIKLLVWLLATLLVITYSSQFQMENMNSFQCFHFKTFLMIYQKFRNFNSQNDSHLKMFEIHFLCTVSHLWKCEWILKHYPNPLPLSWTFSIDHGHNFHLDTSNFLIPRGHFVSLSRVGHAPKLGSQLQHELLKCSNLS